MPDNPLIIEVISAFMFTPVDQSKCFPVPLINAITLGQSDTV
jgi:hypothetical protein